MILLDAIYINDSGGKVLLDYLIENIQNHKIDCFFLLDKRIESHYSNLANDKYFFLKASEKNRYSFYKKHKKSFGKVLCFGNVPPNIRLKVPVYTYFHNLLLLEQTAEISLKMKISLIAKKIFIKLLLKNTDYLIVQTEYVKEKILDHLKFEKEKILVVPFYKNLNYQLNQKRNSNVFTYVSNGNAHKNHRNLLKAWEILYDKGISPELHLTISNSFPIIINLIQKYQTKGIRIINHNDANVRKLYEEADFLVFPSTTESFGLPLVEAAEAGCEIIASDLPYVKAVIEPYGLFNPLVPKSIANEIEKSLEKKRTTLFTRLKVKDQIEYLLNILA